MKSVGKNTYEIRSAGNSRERIKNRRKLTRNGDS